MENKKRKLSGLILTGSALAGMANTAATTTGTGFGDFLKNRVSNFKDITTNLGNKLRHTATSAKFIDFLNSKIDKTKDVATRVGSTLNNVVTKSIIPVLLDKAAALSGSVREPVLTKYSSDSKHNNYNDVNETTNGESKNENRLNSTNAKGEQLNEKLNYYTDSIKERSASKSISNIDVLIKNNDEFDEIMAEFLLRFISYDVLSEKGAGIFSKFLANLGENGIKIFSKLIKKSEKVTDSIWNLIGDCDKSAENFGLLINGFNGSEDRLEKLAKFIEETSFIEHKNEYGEKQFVSKFAVLLRQEEFDQDIAKFVSTIFNSNSSDEKNNNMVSLKKMLNDEFFEDDYAKKLIKNIKKHKSVINIGKVLDNRIEKHKENIEKKGASIGNIKKLTTNNDEFDEIMAGNLIKLLEYHFDIDDKGANNFSKLLATLSNNGIKTFSKLIKKSEEVTHSIWNLFRESDNKSLENFGLLINEVNGSEDSLKKLKEIIENTSCIEHDNKKGERISENTLAILLKQKSFDQTAAKNFSTLFNSENFDVEGMYYFAKLINELCTDLSIVARDTKANNFVTLMKSKNFEEKHILKKFHDTFKILYDEVTSADRIFNHYSEVLRGLSNGLFCSKQFDEKSAEGLATLLSDKNFDYNAFLSLLVKGTFRNRAADILAQLFKNENIAQNFALLIKDKNFDAYAFTSIVSNKAITEETYAHVADNLAKLLSNEDLDISKFASMMLADEFYEKEFINTLAKSDFKVNDFIKGNRLQTEQLEEVVNIKDKNLSAKVQEIEDKVENSTNEANKLKSPSEMNPEGQQITKSNIINDNDSNAKVIGEPKVLGQASKTLGQKLINDKYKEQAFENYENLIKKLRILGANEGLRCIEYYLTKDTKILKNLDDIDKQLNNNFFEILKYKIYDEESINNFASLLNNMDMTIIYLINNIEKENIRNVSKFFFSKPTEKMSKFFSVFLQASEDSFKALPKLFNSKNFDVDKFASFVERLREDSFEVLAKLFNGKNFDVDKITSFVERFGSKDKPNYENLNKLIIKLGEHARENFIKFINNIDDDSIGEFEILINEVPTDTLVKLFNASNFENYINKIIEKFKEGGLEFVPFLKDNDFNEKNFEKFLYNSEPKIKTRKLESQSESVLKPEIGDGTNYFENFMNETFGNEKKYEKAREYFGVLLKECKEGNLEERLKIFLSNCKVSKIREIFVNSKSNNYSFEKHLLYLFNVYIKDKKSIQCLASLANNVKPRSFIILIQKLRADNIHHMLYDKEFDAINSATFFNVCLEDLNNYEDFTKNFNKLLNNENFSYRAFNILINNIGLISNNKGDEYIAKIYKKLVNIIKKIGDNEVMLSNFLRTICYVMGINNKEKIATSDKFYSYFKKFEKEKLKFSFLSLFDKISEKNFIGILAVEGDEDYLDVFNFEFYKYL